MAASDPWRHFVGGYSDGSTTALLRPGIVVGARGRHCPSWTDWRPCLWRYPNPVVMALLHVGVLGRHCRCPAPGGRHFPSLGGRRTSAAIEPRQFPAVSRQNAGGCKNDLLHVLISPRIAENSSNKPLQPTRSYCKPRGKTRYPGGPGNFAMPRAVSVPGGTSHGFGELQDFWSAGRMAC